jgi:hypothetical protein
MRFVAADTGCFLPGPCIDFADITRYEVYAPFQRQTENQGGMQWIWEIGRLEVEVGENAEGFYSGTQLVFPSSLTRAALGMYKDALGGLLKGL